MLPRFSCLLGEERCGQASAGRGEERRQGLAPLPARLPRAASPYPAAARPPRWR